MTVPLIWAIAFLFLRININHAEDTHNLPSITSMDNHNALQGHLDSSVNRWEDVQPKGKGHMRRSRDLNHLKTIKIRLEWFDKSTNVAVDGGYSADLGKNRTVMEELGFSIVNDLNKGPFDVRPDWVGVIQKYFNHVINLDSFDYQVAFVYRVWYEDMRLRTFELSDSLAWRIQNGNHYVNLTSDISGEIVQALYKYHDEGHMRRSRDLKHLKSLKLRLEWFDKSTDVRVDGEYSTDLRNDGTVIEELGLSIVNNVNNGGYDVQAGWVGILQKYFKHQINLGAFDYQVAFDYREWWEDMRVITFELYDSPAWRTQNGNHYVHLTPNVSGEIVRAVYKHHGHIFPKTMMRVYLLGTSIDCDLGSSKDIEFSPVQKILNSGQPFEVSHGIRATKTRHDSFEILRPLQITFTFTVRVKV